MKRVKKKSVVRLFGLLVFSVVLLLMNGNQYCMAAVSDSAVVAEEAVEAPAEKATNEVEEEAEVAEESAEEAAEEVAEESVEESAKKVEDAAVITTPSVGESFDTSETVGISSIEDLKSFSDEVNNGQTNWNAKLTDNIDIVAGEEWNPIGKADHPYSGVFDGGEHTITFPDASYKLFDYVGEDASIHNLNVYYYNQNEYIVGSYQEISSFDDLYKFSRLVYLDETDLNVQLTDNIEAEKKWTPIGTEKSPYTGEFNGDGFTIIFPNASYRLFKSVNPGEARIYNLTVSYGNDYYEHYTSKVLWDDSSYDQSDYAIPPANIQGYPDTYKDETISGDTKEDLVIDSNVIEDTQPSGKAPVQENNTEISPVVDVSTDEGIQISSKTSDTITPHVFVALFSLLGLSFVAFWMLRREKTK